MALIFVFTRIKATRIVNSLSVTKKGCRREASVKYTLLHKNEFIFKLLLGEGTYLKFEIVHKGEKYSLRHTSRMQNIEFVG